MAQQFLHGIETVNLTTGPRPVTEVKTAVIGLVGIAPTGFGKDVCKLIKNDVDAAQYGSPLPGFDIPQALSQIFAHNAGTVIVVNVFDEATHTTAVVEEAKTVLNGKLKLGAAPIGAVTIKTAAGAATAYVKGTDYNLDVYGNFTVIAGRIANNLQLKFDYKKLNSAAVSTAHIIGTVGADGNRTGIKAFDLAFGEFGFRPKILIAPGRSATKAIADELLSSAERMVGVALIDSVKGEDVQTTISNRGDATKAFGTSNKRAVLCYPYLKAYDASKDDGLPETDTRSDYPFSPFLAGLMAWADNEFGYWNSPSNNEFKGVLGMERPISANINDADTDANALNEAGIVTVFNSFGTGFKAWGNRNASFPINTQTNNFIPVLRTLDMWAESLIQASIPFVDKPLNQALIDDIRQTGNDFAATLVGRGALTEGSNVQFDRAKNPNTQLAAGHVVFSCIEDAPSPAERITFEHTIDISLKGRLR
ncbi:phage tail sheath subtilisin-like domain-containing protein [Terrimonas sp. NA20]|uniref:Phage tail sheath subtilisin-like domain-containing protein n=1 Tax=Terrimonas ginsenosidimutans TaxID=2908004 RepID=A0ABS9KRJ2_9BACT|nr:phage tail sheath subtilisin-like domain-containing protein [Terrimonas ginsenosidimutans]MCG2614894.1 phage tail sheath subtilisin-like domain-containing protein [Terrimonas ginsenosidimutans]